MESVRASWRTAQPWAVSSRISPLRRIPSLSHRWRDGPLPLPPGAREPVARIRRHWSVTLDAPTLLGRVSCRPPRHKANLLKDLTQSRLFLVVLVAATALGPLAMQIFLPSLPAIQHGLGVSAVAVQLVVSVSMVAIAVSMLIYGPLSDRYGRRPVLVAGLALFLIGSVVSAAAPDIGFLVVGRTVQAVGGAAAFVLTRAIVRDVYGRARAASMIAYITLAMIVAPMLAPVIGGALNDAFGWRANFAFTAIVCVLVTGLVVWRLPETHHERVAVPGVAAMVGSFGRLLRIPAFCGFAFQSTFSMAIFFTFATAAPYVVITVMGRPAAVYGAFFMLLSASFMTGAFVAGRVSERVGVERMVVAGAGLALVGAAATVLSLVALGWTPWALFGPVLLIGLGNGVSMPNAMAGAISVDPRAAGAASGLAGFLQMFVAAGFAQVAGAWQNGTPYPMVGFMLGAAILAFAATGALLRTKQPGEARAPAE